MVTLLSVQLNSFFIGQAKANYREHRFPNEKGTILTHMSKARIFMCTFFIIIVLAIPPLMMFLSNYPFHYCFLDPVAMEMLEHLSLLL